MRYREFVREGDPQMDPSVLLSALELMAHEASDKGMPPVIKMNDLIQIVKQPGTTFDYNALVQYYKTVPAVKNLIKSFNRDEVVLKDPDGVDEFTTGADGVDVDLGTDTVARMAHSALNKRK